MIQKHHATRFSMDLWNFNSDKRNYRKKVMLAETRYNSRDAVFHEDGASCHQT